MHFKTGSIRLRQPSASQKHGCYALCFSGLQQVRKAVIAQLPAEARLLCSLLLRPTGSARS